MSISTSATGSEPLVQLVYVSREGEVYSESLPLCPGQSVRDVIAQSGLLARHPEIDLAIHRTGIFGQLCSLDSIPVHGDRIEVYRPLLVDPKSARRNRAATRARGGRARTGAASDGDGCART